MDINMKRIVIIAILFAILLTGCAIISGLDQYHNVPCVENCGEDSGDGGGSPNTMETSQ
jgi:hypothetical protein